MFNNRHHHTHIARLFRTAALSLPRRVVVEGDSMLPTFRPGDRLILVPWRNPRPGHVVALADPRDGERLMIKRVSAIGLDGIDVRGDNADASTDSRHFGLVGRRAVARRVAYRYSPRSRSAWWPH